MHSLSLSFSPSLYLSLPLPPSLPHTIQGDASDSDAGKKRKKKYRLEVHHQQVFADSADDVS